MCLSSSRSHWERQHAVVPESAVAFELPLRVGLPKRAFDMRATLLLLPKRAFDMRATLSLGSPLSALPPNLNPPEERSRRQSSRQRAGEEVQERE